MCMHRWTGSQGLAVVSHRFDGLPSGLLSLQEGINMIIRHRAAVFALDILLSSATFSCTPRDAETPGLQELSGEPPATTLSQRRT